MRTLVSKHSGGDYYPGKPRANPGGRLHVITEHQEQEIARAAMDLKKRELDPSPALVRAKLPRLTVNRTTGNTDLRRVRPWYLQIVVVTKQTTIRGAGFQARRRAT